MDKGKILQKISYGFLIIGYLMFSILKLNKQEGGHQIALGLIIFGWTLYIISAIILKTWKSLILPICIIGAGIVLAIIFHNIAKL